MPIDQGTLDGVNNVNVKTLGETQTVNYLAHQNRTFLLAEASLAQQLNRMNSLDPAESAAIQGVVGADLAKALGNLAAMVSNTQQMLKGAQSTPPPTAT